LRWSRAPAAASDGPPPSPCTPRASSALLVEPRKEARPVAEAVLYMAHLPLEANVLFMTVMATAMPFVGRG
jgi:hypothetical protein